MTEHAIINSIKNSGRIPAIPDTFGNVFRMLIDSYHYDMDVCVQELIKYPQLVDSLISVLNTFSKLDRKIITVKDAIIYLGTKNTRLIAISFLTRLLLPDKEGRTKVFDKRKYWKHCLGTSIAAYKLADKIGLSNKDKVFVYGLIHDIGVTLLAITLPDKLDSIHSLQQKGLHQIAAEKIVLSGITHADIGMWLCKEWNLPKEIIEIVAYHHTPFVSCENSVEVRLLHLADAISTNYYETLLGNHTTFLYSDKIRTSLNLAQEDISEINAGISDEINKIYKLLDFNSFWFD